MKWLALLVGGGIWTKVALWVMGLFMVAGGVFGTVHWIDANRLESKIEEVQKDNKEIALDNAILKANNTTLKDNLKKLAEANLITHETAQKLLDERAETQGVIDKLAEQAKKEKQMISKLSAQIDEMLKDPKNEGILAPVLRETIREIQRARREAL